MVRCAAIFALPVAASAAHVVVVGGGFAGLGAATELEKAGHTVTLLEAKDHLGGRAFTDKSSFDFAFDMGAMWIHGIKTNPLYEMANKFGVQTMVTDYDNLRVFDHTGTEVADSKIETLYDKFSAKMNRLRNEADKDVSLGASMEKTLSSLGLSQEEQNLMRFKVCDEIELDIAASVYNASGYWYDADANLPGGDVLIVDPRGFAGLVEAIAAGLKDVSLNTSVTKVDYSSSNGVSVHTSAGIINADYVVMTASLGVLKTDIISFVPALPTKIEHAIKSLGCDVSDKVVLEFPQGSAQHWGGADKDVFYIMNKETAHHGEFVETWNMKHYRNVDVLATFSVGPRDWALIEDVASDDQMGAAALAHLRLAFPTLPDPIKVHVHRWGRDKYAQCAWSSWYLGSSKLERDSFLTNTGRLHFAGEHTDSTHPGTTHGAWNTGVSAAAAIKAAEASTGWDAEGAALMRAAMHKPRPEDVFKGRPLRSPKKEWSRMQKAKASIFV